MTALASAYSSAEAPVQAQEAPALPHSYEAEQALLGILMYDNAAYERLPDGLKGEHFYEPFHQRLYSAIEDYIRKGMLAEPVILMERFKADPAFEQMGGFGYFHDLVDRAPPLVNARDYAQTIMGLSLRREVIRIAEGAAKVARLGLGEDGEEVEPRAMIERAENELFSLAETGQSGGGVSTFSDALAGAVEMIGAAFERDGKLTGLATGLDDLDRKLGGLHPSDLLILAGRPSMGKAQPLSAKVLMRDGTWKAMGDLRLGDELASIDGAPSRVAGVFPQGERQVYRVTLRDGRSTRACGEHLWHVESAKLAGGSRVVSTDELRAMLAKARYQSRVSLPLVSGHFGEDRDLLIDPWLLGALLGNGCMGEGGSVSISTADAATLFRVQKAVGENRLSPRNADGYDYRITQRGDPGLKRALLHYGLAGKTSADKFVPAPYLAASREARLELLRGLLDTDGWVETFGAVRFASSSEQLAKDVQALVCSLGGVCTINAKRAFFRHKGEKREGLTSYVCNISHPDRGSLLTLKRKQRRCVAEARFRSPSITSIEADGVEPVQCIQVTHPSSLYVTDDYMVTHNTALAVNIAFNVARRYRYELQPDGTIKTVEGGRVLFYSLEMSKEQLAARALADVSGVSGDRMRKGEIEPHEFARIRDARAEIDGAPLHIDDTGGLSIAKLCARARRLKRKHGLDLIVVDYLQLVNGSDGKKGQGRVQEVSEITMNLKALAKELSVPIVALSQLSRQVEQREDKRPQLSDLRESGSIEQDADAVMFVFREAYYVGRAEPRDGTEEHLQWQEQMARLEHVAEVIIGKQRHGPIGTVKLSFDADTTRFGNLAQEGRYDQHERYSRGPAPATPRIVHSFGGGE